MNDEFLTDSISFYVSVEGRTTSVPHVRTFQVYDNQILTLVNVGIERITERDEINGGYQLNTRIGRRTFRAIWDTGAVQTMVEPNVIEELDLHPEGCAITRGIDGINRTRDTFRMLLILAKNPVVGGEPGLPNVMSIHPVVAGRLERDGQLGGNFDLLVGMDIIQRVDFAISTGIDGNVWCSIRHPASGYRTNYDGVV